MCVIIPGEEPEAPLVLIPGLERIISSVLYIIDGGSNMGHGVLRKLGLDDGVCIGPNQGTKPKQQQYVPREPRQDRTLAR